MSVLNKWCLQSHCVCLVSNSVAVIAALLLCLLNRFLKWKYWLCVLQQQQRWPKKKEWKKRNKGKKYYVYFLGEYNGITAATQLELCFNRAWRQNFRFRQVNFKPKSQSVRHEWIDIKAYSISCPFMIFTSLARRTRWMRKGRKRWKSAVFSLSLSLFTL